jgi:hypothetical protein
MKSLRLLVALCGSVMLGSTQAALIDRGNGMIYDDVLNITWLQDANYAKTSGHDADGRMTWNESMAWASSLIFGGYDDWRLPFATQPDAGCSNHIPSHGIDF